MKVEIYYVTQAELESWHYDYEKYKDKAGTITKCISEGKTDSFAKVHEFNFKNHTEPIELANTLYTLFNGMLGGEDPMGKPNPLGCKMDEIISLGVNHKSMSMGDFIVFPDKVLVVDEIGFAEVPKIKCEVLKQ